MIEKPEGTLTDINVSTMLKIPADLHDIKRVHSCGWIILPLFYITWIYNIPITSKVMLWFRIA